MTPESFRAERFQSIRKNNSEDSPGRRIIDMVGSIGKLLASPVKRIFCVFPVEEIDHAHITPDVLSNLRWNANLYYTR